MTESRLSRDIRVEKCIEWTSFLVILDMKSIKSASMLDIKVCKVEFVAKLDIRGVKYIE